MPYSDTHDRQNARRLDGDGDGEGDDDGDGDGDGRYASTSLVEKRAQAAAAKTAM